MKRLWMFLAALISVFVFAAPVRAAAGWQVLKTEHFTVFYPPELEETAREVLATLEYYRPAIEELVGNELFRLPVVIEDTGYPNGYYDPVYRNIHLFITPPDPATELAATENWWSLVGIHEYIHALAGAKTAGLVKFLQAVLGNLVIPNAYVPGWLAEGITVFGESQVRPYQGRLNDGYYDAYIGACVKEGRLPSLLKATYCPRDEYPPGGFYLFGGEFFRYLAETYGRDRFARFFAENGGNLWSSLSLGTFLPGLGIDAGAKKVYGRSFPELWQEWQDYERKRFKDFQMEGERLTHHGWYVEDPKIDGDKLYYRRSYPVDTGERVYYLHETVVRDLTTGQEKTLFTSPSGFTMPARIHQGRLYYARREYGPGFANASELTFGEYAVLHVRDLKTGRDRKLLAARMRAFAVLPDGKILYSRDRRDAFGSELRLFDPVRGTEDLLGRLDYSLEEMTADETRVVVAARRDWQNPDLYELSLADLTLTPLVQTPFTEAGLSLQGDRLFYHSNYRGTYAVYGYDFRTKKIFRLTENGYAASPVLDEVRGVLYYLGLTAAGFDLYRKEAVFREFIPEEFPRIDPPLLRYDALRAVRGDYVDNLATLAPALRLPFFATTADGPVLGGFFSGADAIGHFAYRTMLAFYPAEDRLVYNLTVENYLLAPLQTAFYLSNDQDGDLVPDYPAIGLAGLYPLHVGYGPGLSGLYLGLSTLYLPDYLFWTVNPSVTAEFTFPRAGVTLTYQETAYTQTGFTLTGLKATVRADSLLGRGSLTWRGDYFNDPFLGGEVGVRGMAPCLTLNGLNAGVEYAHPLLRVNTGFWNPNLFMEKIYFKLFYDGALDLAPEADRYYYAYGAELHLTGKIAMFFPFNAYLRCSSTNGGPFGLTYGLSVDLPF